MLQTTIGEWWPAAPWLPAVLAGPPVLWAWWRESGFGRLIVACTIWFGLVWFEVHLFGAPQVPGFSVIHVNHSTAIVPIDGRHFTGLASGLGYCLMFCIDGWLAWYVSKFPRYWHERDVPQQSWYLEIYENFERRLQSR